jgi:hypothetical protein
VIFTAGVRTGRFARRSVTRATEYEGVLHTIEAAGRQAFRGRFVYMRIPRGDCTRGRGRRAIGA